MAEPKLAVRLHINPGPICDHLRRAEQGWSARNECDRLSGHSLTNATSEDASCAANGLRHELRIIEARTTVF